MSGTNNYTQLAEDAFIVNGGNKLEGEIHLSGAKNVALKVIIAALLFEGDVILENIPRIYDVIELVHLINTIGGVAEFTGPHTLRVNGENIKSSTLDMLYASKIRVSFMFFAPLLYKFGEAHVPNPGGCRIGARPIDRTIEGLKHLGIQVEYNSEDGYYHAKMSAPPAGKFSYEKSSVTSTELLIISSVFTKKGVTIENAALEPEIDDLIHFLNVSGANIKRINESIFIAPADKLTQKEPYPIVSDRIEAATYIAACIATKGELYFSNLKEEHMRKFHEKLKLANVGLRDLGNNRWYYSYTGSLKATDITTRPHPGFMTDWQPIWSVLMTQAEGQSIVHERVYENRFAYMDDLRKLGADIDFVKVPVVNPAEFFFFNFDPAKKYNQAIRIVGPQKLHGGVVKINDLRAGATLAIAALVAQGESIIDQASVLERGYENFVEKISHLGGDIKKV